MPNGSDATVQPTVHPTVQVDGRGPIAVPAEPLARNLPRRPDRETVATYRPRASAYDPEQTRATRDEIRARFGWPGSAEKSAVSRSSVRG